jgi:hypothetical protein
MSSYQEHFGKKFYQDKKKGYWISTTTNPRIRAHQWVWINNHGKPPKGTHIHHRDENKSNNCIENLELIHGKKHIKHHMNKRMLDPNNKKKAQQHCENIRGLTKQWHQSEEGKAWHKFHAIRTKFGNGEYYKYKCQECENEYESKLIAEGRTKFCSNACKSKWRRKEKLDDVDKICPICKNIYRSNKYSKVKTCSRICGRQLTI